MTPANNIFGFKKRKEEGIEKMKIHCSHVLLNCIKPGLSFHLVRLVAQDSFFNCPALDFIDDTLNFGCASPTRAWHGMASWVSRCPVELPQPIGGGVLCSGCFTLGETSLAGVVRHETRG